MPYRTTYNRRHVLLGITALAVPGISSAQPAPSTAEKLIAAATRQIGVTKIYDPAYVRLAFPLGDVPADRGVCTDVIVRAYREAFGVDLQAKVNADMKASFAAYPKRWGLAAPDANIDHRRVGNLQVFFARQKGELPKPARSTDWQPGDLATMLVSGKLPHIGIVSNTHAPSTNRPLLIHNIGQGTQLEDVLEQFPITGRYRWGGECG